jgi:hypothetical protein
MSLANPTALRVGARGTIHGWTVTVAGRVVLGVEVDGERYFWNEYNLVDASGNSGTLVYEEGENGPEWKLFQLLPPQLRPLTVAEAETKQVGDRVSFGGPEIPITLVDRSRVHHIEGQAPEGVEVGDLADFFNADAGDHMIVASWTGNEIEFYEGRDVPTETVATAFGLSRGAPGFRPAASAAEREAAADDDAPSARKKRPLWIWILGVSLIWFVAAGAFRSCFPAPSSGRPSATPSRQAPPAPPPLQLAANASGNLAGQTYTVTGYDQVEIGRTRGRQQGREYLLASSNQESARLLQGVAGGTREWHLLRREDPPPDLSPYRAAALRRGGAVTLGGKTVRVTELFLTELRGRQRQGAAEPATRELYYGFLVNTGPEIWLARWNEHELTVHRGTRLEEAAVRAAFAPGPEKPR